jgi:hypothetical protein
MGRAFPAIARRALRWSSSQFLLAKITSVWPTLAKIDPKSHRGTTIRSLFVVGLIGIPRNAFVLSRQPTLVSSANRKLSRNGLRGTLSRVGVRRHGASPKPTSGQRGPWRNFRIARNPGGGDYRSEGHLCHRNHYSFAYSASACFRMGISASALFQRVRKSW